MSRTVTSSDVHGGTYEVALEELSWRPSAYAIVIEDGKILLTRQRGQYHLPGGGLDFGETPEEAVVREVKEETGFEVSHPRAVDVAGTFFTWNNGREKFHYQTLLLFYVCKLKGGQASIDGMEPEESETGELPEWVPLEDLPTITRGSTFDWMSIVHKALGHS